MTTTHPLNVKYVNVTPPAAIVDNASFSTTEVDTIGYEYATYLVSFGATDVDITAFALTESDASGSGHTTVSGADFTGGYPTATDDNEVWAINVDLKGRKRYLDLTLTAGDGTTGTYASVLCVLSKAKTAPPTAAEQGLGGRKIV